MLNFSKHNERSFLKSTSQKQKNRALYEGVYWERATSP
nr:MAG TPA: hypothetical protein [Caudoviricetes sp.]